jgi:hypothetical protein
MRRDERQLLTFLALLPDGVAWGADERFAHPYAHRAGLVDLTIGTVVIAGWAVRLVRPHHPWAIAITRAGRRAITDRWT